MDKESQSVMAKLVPGFLVACGALAIAIYAIFWLQPAGWEIKWEAWATFAAGALAVGAALVVGWKQAAIQERQAQLQLLEIKVGLLNERIELIKSAKELMVEISQGYPDTNDAFALSDLRHRITLIFPDNVLHAFENCKDQALALTTAKFDKRVGEPVTQKEITAREVAFNQAYDRMHQAFSQCARINEI
jgi:hypothetical protein